MEGEEFDCLTVSGSFCAWYINSVASVMVSSWSNIPAIYSMRSPCAADCWFFMHYAFGAEGGDGCSVEIEGTIEHGLCSHIGV